MNEFKMKMNEWKNEKRWLMGTSYFIEIIVIEIWIKKETNLIMLVDRLNKTDVKD